MRVLPKYVFATLEERVHAYAASSQSGGRLINLGIGSPDQPMPAPVADALGEAAHASDVSGYPRFRGDPRFLNAASRYLSERFGHDFDPDTELLALAGSKEGIAQLIMAVVGQGDVVLVPDIYYPVYARAAMLAGAEVEFLPMRAENGFLVDWSHVSADTLRRAKMLVVNYPNNPTGAVAGLDFYERAVAFAREHDLILISDAAYCELAYDGFTPPSVFDVDGARDVAVELYSTSKSFNMAGLRLGFIGGAARFVDLVADFRTSIGYGVPTVIQRAGALALEQWRELAPLACNRYRERRDATVAAFRDAGWDVPAPHGAMYLWFRVPGGDDWQWTANVLDHTGVALTPGSAFGDGGKGFARLSLVRDVDTLREAVRRITGMQPGLR